jgi:hypothetical protein
MTSDELAEWFYDELEEAILTERPVKLVYIGHVTSLNDLLAQWENGMLCL